MSLFRKVINLGDDFVSLLFPRVCQSCGETLVRNEKLLCIFCLADIPYTNYHLKRDNILEKELWGRCYAEQAAAMFFYRHGSKVQKLMHRLKYNGVKEIGVFLGEMYGHKLIDSGYLDGIDLIIPVPLHAAKERKRGFNQSRVIANGVSAATGLPVDTKILKRTERSSTQTRKSRVERWENVKDIFKLQDPGLLQGKHILLVDDVITTGSTIESCINTIKKESDVKVSVISLAVAVK